MAPRIRTKRVYDAPEKDDGTRVLVMRLWPRGVRKKAVSLWLKELGAERPLITAYKSGGLAWSAFARRYRAGLAKPEARRQLDELAALARRGTATLLCGCADEARCHRSILRKALEG